MPERTCEVGGCGRAPRSLKAALCNAHYFRKRRTGETGAASIWDRQRKPCAAADCDSVADGGLGFCSKHYQRVKSHGSPNFVLPNHRFGEDHWAWKPDRDIGYSAAHDQVRAARGPAANYPCVNCGAEARQWAYDHADPNERSSDVGPYSVDIEHYQPMCVPCHKRFDLGRVSCQRSAQGA